MASAAPKTPDQALQLLRDCFNLLLNPKTEPGSLDKKIVENWQLIDTDEHKEFRKVFYRYLKTRPSSFLSEALEKLSGSDEPGMSAMLRKIRKNLNAIKDPALFGEVGADWTAAFEKSDHLGAGAAAPAPTGASIPRAALLNWGSEEEGGAAAPAPPPTPDESDPDDDSASVTARRQ